MLFRKDMDPRCAYCDKGNQINEQEVICKKRGIVPMDGCCRAFRYDPLKRTPPRPVKLNTARLSEADFTI